MKYIRKIIAVLFLLALVVVSVNKSAASISSASTKLKSIHIFTEVVILEPKQSFDLELIFAPYTADYKKISWKSSNTSIAKVVKGKVKYDSKRSKIGMAKVTAIKAGTATITAQVDGLKATCTINVLGAGLNQQSLSMKTSKKENLKMMGAKAVEWKSSNPRVASVNQSGEVCSHVVGQATIFCKADDGNSYQCAVEVLPADKVKNLNVQYKKCSTRYPSRVAVMKLQGGEVAWECKDDPDGKFYLGMEGENQVALFFLASKPGTYSFDVYSKGMVWHFTYIFVDEEPSGSTFDSILKNYDKTAIADYLNYDDTTYSFNVDVKSLPTATSFK